MKATADFMRTAGVPIMDTATRVAFLKMIKGIVGKKAKQPEGDILPAGMKPGAPPAEMNNINSPVFDLESSSQKGALDSELNPVYRRTLK
jgi:hypothetical protein